MRITNKKRNDEEVNFWQTVSDVMAALLLILLLVVMLLILYIVRTKMDDYTDYHPETEALVVDYDEDDGHDEDYRETERETWQEEDDHDDDGAYDSGGYDGDGGDDGEYESEPVWYGDEEGLDKTAVYVTVTDAETQNTIKEAGIQFELYSAKGALQVLNTYYPIKTAYRDYETTENGVFYLPEKLKLGDYYLRELTEPTGYDAAANTAFSAEKSLDWPEAMIVNVALYPSRNIIRVQTNDADSGEKISGGSYDVIAAEDVITADGTLRYSAGEVVDQIVCDEDGYGESTELYLGNYILKQREIPEFYVGDGEPIKTVVEKKSGDLLPKLHQQQYEKTTVVYTVKDELYNNLDLEDAVLSLTWDGKTGTAQRLQTDEYGQVVLTDLNKNTTYRVRQKSTLEGYAVDPAEYTFKVDSEGRVNGESRVSYEILNRKLRISIGIRDIILQNDVSDINVALYDASDHLIKVWDSRGMEELIEGLSAGKYYVVIAGNDQEKKEFVIEDSAEIQKFAYPVWTNNSIGMIAIGVFLVIVILLAVIIIIRKRRKNT